MALISLTYVSFEAYPMTEADLLKILDTAHKFNPSQNITGMLLFRNGYFIQALEGDDAAVDALYEKIAADPRHRNVMLVARESISRRSFGDWAMGFKNLHELDLTQYEDYIDLLKQPFNDQFFAENPSRAKTLLKLFVEEASY